MLGLPVSHAGGTKDVVCFIHYDLCSARHSSSTLSVVSKMAHLYLKQFLKWLKFMKIKEKLVNFDLSVIKLVQYEPK
jgi:hypothetical protein